MNIWHVHLLGSPYLVCNGKEARPQAKETRAVLASLLLPDALGTSRSLTSTSVPFSLRHSRQALAERFWGDKDDPRVHLRQSLSLLKKTFDAECFVTERESIQVAAGRFVTDVGQMLDAYRLAMAAEELEERLHHFAEAVTHLHGDFLEGCFQPGDCGEPWMLGRRAEIRRVITDLLTAYMEALLEGERLQGALEIAYRILEWQPDHKAARKQMRELAGKLGPLAFPPAPDAAEEFQTLAERLRTIPGKNLTLTDRRVFLNLFQLELATLPPKYKKPLLRLSIFPAPFSAEMAYTVCRVSEGVLRYLAKRHLIEQQGEKFALMEVAQSQLWLRVPATTRQHLFRRLDALWEEWLLHTRTDTNTVLPFGSVEHARLFLQKSLQWRMQQPFTRQTLKLIYGVCTYRSLDLAATALPYLEGIYQNAEIPLCHRVEVAGHAGNIHFTYGDFESAARLYERLLVLHSEEPEMPDIIEATDIHLALGTALHYNGNSQAALTNIEKAIEYDRRAANPRKLSHSLRFLGEIQTSYGNYEPALLACEEAVKIRRDIQADPDAVADALYWQGDVLRRLGRWRDASECCEEALSLWQKTNDTTGIAFCLRMMGQIHCEQGRLAEARAHVEHAILLHARTGDQGSRMAAVAALADILFQQQEFPQAQRFYAECLAHYEAKSSVSRIEHFRAKITACA